MAGQQPAPSPGSGDVQGVPIKVTGALAGVVFVADLAGPVASLRSEIARLLGVADPKAIKLIVGGRTLQDDQKRLSEAGVSAISRVLVTRGVVDAGSASAEAEQQRRLERMRVAAEKLAGRDARGLTDNYALEIENQNGGTVAVKEDDRRALVVGLALHSKGRATMERGEYGTALDELLMAEEALGLCDRQLTDAVDNVPMLLLDIVWCCYKLGDLRRLAVCRDRLARARAGLARAHGPALERLRGMHGSFTPELATYVRLEVLEGLVAYYSREPAATAEASLRSAQAKWQRLQVSDESLAALQSMGYDLREGTRGLRFSGGSDVAGAIDFIGQQRIAAEERRARRRRAAAWNKERVRYGKTGSGAYVDQQQLDGLQGMGYAREVAAEALRRSDNRGQEALDVLSRPDRRRALEMDMALQKALKEAGSHGASTASTTAAGADPATASLAASLAAAMAGQHRQQQQQQQQDRTGPSTSAPAAAAGSVAGASGSARRRRRRRQGARGSAEEAGGDAMGGGSEEDEREEDDEADDDPEVAAAEQDLVAAVRGGDDDPMSAYDLDVAEEGDIIATFLTLLASASASASPAGPHPSPRPPAGAGAPGGAGA